MPRLVHIFVLALFSALALSAAVAASASATPAWKFEGKALEGTEQVAGAAAESTLTAFGLTTTCNLSYLMTISNSAGTATGSVVEMNFGGCVVDDPACTVEAAAAEALPWSVTGKSVSSVPYAVFKGIKFQVVYAGGSCALEGVEVTFTGSAGGRYDNSVGTFVFSPANFFATGTQVKALGSSVVWEALLTTEALEAHQGQILHLG